MPMKKLLTSSLIVASLFVEASAFAQAPAGGGGTRRPAAARRPQRQTGGPSRPSPSLGSSVSGGIGLPSAARAGAARQPRRNSTPVLSPYLNLDPTFASSFEGQYLTKILPQQEFNRTQVQTQRAFDTVQGEVGQQQADLASGLGSTGHRTSFRNLGQYYSTR